MSALPNPDVPQNKQVDPVSRFIASYAKALDAAKVSMAHTATQGWRDLYERHAKAVMEDRRNLAGELGGLADELERGMLSEDGEKAVGEVKKAAAELRTANHYWELQTVDPVRQPVRVCEAILSSAIDEARRIEAESPLTNSGLVKLMRAAVSRCARPAWDSETGTISISGEKIDQGTGEVTSA
jgi:hypothetical protein